MNEEREKGERKKKNAEGKGRKCNSYKRKSKSSCAGRCVCEGARAHAYAYNRKRALNIYVNICKLCKLVHKISNRIWIIDNTKLKSLFFFDYQILAFDERIRINKNHFFNRLARTYLV